MSERKNIKRNKNRPHADQKGRVASLQKSYYKPVKKPEEKTAKLF